jgi:hypothetical protein
LRFLFSSFVADEKALKEITGMKGASGTHCCLKCMNVVGRHAPSDLQDNPFLVHFTCAEHHRFVPWTGPDLDEALEELRAAWAERRRVHAQRRETELGITYPVHGGLLAAASRFALNLPSSLFYDYMHTLFASGGVAQYELNAFFLQVLALDGFDFDTIEEFKNEVVFPGGRRLRKFVLRDRVVAGHAQHMRTFAQETWDLLVVAFFFVSQVLEPAGCIADHCNCVKMLFQIVRTLQCDASEVDFNTLRQLVAMHQTAFLLLYPDAAKPKLHFLWHIIESFEATGQCLHCFPTERRHKATKQPAAFCFRAFHKTLLARTTISALTKSEEVTAFCATSTVGTTSAVPASLGLLGPYWRRARAVRTQHGTFSKGDFIKVFNYVAFVHEVLCEGFAFRLLVKKCLLCRAHTYKVSEELELVDAQQALRALVHIRVNEEVLIYDL